MDSPQSSPFLTTKTQIDALQSINGLSIEEIEQRARPGHYSCHGFIGKEENFKDVLRKDWDTVKKLNVTHQELAAHLKNIISIAKSVQESTKNFFDAIEIEYEPTSLEGNTICSRGPQKLYIGLMESKGTQEDLFQPKGENELPQVNTPKQWGDEHIFLNPNNNVKLRVTSGILSYIHEFGFYEGGGDQNPYRIDPTKVVALITGI